MKHLHANTPARRSSHARCVIGCFPRAGRPTQICRTSQCAIIRHITRSGDGMSALANHSFSKMNGIGNEIVVVDLRDRPAVVTAEEARAVASPAGVHYDQLMVLQSPRL